MCTRHFSWKHYFLVTNKGSNLRNDGIPEDVGREGGGGGGALRGNIRMGGRVPIVVAQLFGILLGAYFMRGGTMALAARTAHSYVSCLVCV